MHPGFKFNNIFQWKSLWALAASDAVEFMVRKVRPYELDAGQSNRVYDRSVEELSLAFEKSTRAVIKTLKKIVENFNAIPSDRTVRRPRVFVTGEILLHAHPTANYRVEEYMESHGMEIQPAPIFPTIRMKTLQKKAHRKDFFIQYPLFDTLHQDLQASAFAYADKKMVRIMKSFKYSESRTSFADLQKSVQPFLDTSYIAGEGWVLVAELLENAHLGVDSTVILQPFGCLPNHIIGRGLTKKVKELYPHMQILSLDFDPDTSMANIENRLQMLIIGAKEREKQLRVEKKAVSVSP